MVQFLKTTLIGGILFLVPIIIFIAVIGKAVRLIKKLATIFMLLLDDSHFYCWLHFVFFHRCIFIWKRYIHRSRVRQGETLVCGFAKDGLPRG